MDWLGPSPRSCGAKQADDFLDGGVYLDFAATVLFTGAKISRLGQLPQGRPERHERALKTMAQMNAEAFGGCTNVAECVAAYPKNSTLENIARMIRDYDGASWTKRTA